MEACSPTSLIVGLQVDMSGAGLKSGFLKDAEGCSERNCPVFRIEGFSRARNVLKGAG